MAKYRAIGCYGDDEYDVYFSHRKFIFRRVARLYGKVFFGSDFVGTKMVK